MRLRSSPLCQRRFVVLRHLLRQVAIDAAGTVVGRVHARARDRLVDVHQFFALAERVQEHRHRAQIERVRADPHQVIQDAGDLVEHGADVLRALRRLDAQQGLDRAHVGVLVAHHRHVVEPIHVADRLVERLGLGQLLGAAMQQADVRIGAHDGLAVHLHAPGAARRARPDAAGRSSSCSCGFPACSILPPVVGGFGLGLHQIGDRRGWCAAPARAARSTPARRSPASARGRSALRRCRSAGNPCGTDGRRNRSR